MVNGGTRELKRRGDLNGGLATQRAASTGLPARKHLGLRANMASKWTRKPALPSYTRGVPLMEKLVVVLKPID